ncbi:DUF4363 family protein [Candidatus Soleaferrea massiliensis]|uniref:DUF4363 family protein n=1 Tax=Candidatus Soleaferrea massiliensis TaxID=1470354 RepID=UPI00058E0281|nr:DUF4363 family protein [Candidatus Soleaferrea massiliensis]
MKRFIIAVCIFLLLIGTCLFGLYEVYNVKNDMSASLEEIGEQVLNNHLEKAQQSIENLKKDWIGYEKKLVQFVGHIPLNEISSTLEGLTYYIQYDDTATFFAELHRIKSLVDHVWYTEIPTLTNIF